MCCNVRCFPDICAKNLFCHADEREAACKGQKNRWATKSLLINWHDMSVQSGGLQVCRPSGTGSRFQGEVFNLQVWWQGLKSNGNDNQGQSVDGLEKKGSHMYWQGWSGKADKGEQMNGKDQGPKETKEMGSGAEGLRLWFVGWTAEDQEADVGTGQMGVATHKDSQPRRTAAYLGLLWNAVCRWLECKIGGCWQDLRLSSML